jgi:hypothetical protein
MIDAGTLETLLHISEGETIDFKGAHYALNAEHEKAELIKDVLAFANGWRTSDAYILTGVVEPVDGKRAEVLGVVKGEHPDDADLQQLVNGKTNRPVRFAYFAAQADGKSIGVLHVPLGQERPIWLKKDFVFLKGEKVYIRRGSSTAIADLDEVARMGAARATAGVLPDPRSDRKTAQQQHLARVPFLYRPGNPLHPSQDGKLLVTVVPAGALIPDALIDLDPWGSDHRLEPMAASGTWSTRFNADGVLTLAGKEPRAYSQVLRSGVIESAMCVSRRTDDGHFIGPWTIEEEVVALIGRVMPLLHRSGAESCSVHTSVVGIEGARTPRSTLRGREGLVDRNDVHLPDLVLKTSDASDLPARLRPVFDVLWQSLGFAKSLTYAADGTWQGTTFKW